MLRKYYFQLSYYTGRYYSGYKTEHIDMGRYGDNSVYPSYVLCDK